MTQGNKDVLKNIKKGLKAVCIEGEPIRRKRMNDVGNALEPIVKKSLQDQGLDVDFPKTKSGKLRRVGYPDLIIYTLDAPIYLEIKAYTLKQQKGSLRTLYLSSSLDPKVNEDGHHILAGFEMKENGAVHVPIKYDLIDLHGLLCDLKTELNSNNKRLYDKKRRITRFQKPPKLFNEEQINS